MLTYLPGAYDGVCGLAGWLDRVSVYAYGAGMGKVRIGAKERQLQALRRTPGRAVKAGGYDAELVERVMKMREGRREYMRAYMREWRRKHRGEKT